MISTQSAVTVALTWNGIVAKPGTPGYGRYRDIIANGESSSRADEIVQVWGCGLVARGFLAMALNKPPRCVLAPYFNGQAMKDVRQAAQSAKADRMPTTYVPEPGDIVDIAGNIQGPEHDFIITSVSHLSNGWYVESIQGGVKVEGYSAIEARTRHLVRTKGWHLEDQEFNGPSRYVWSFYSLRRMMAFYV